MPNGTHEEERLEALECRIARLELAAGLAKPRATAPRQPAPERTAAPRPTPRVPPGAGSVLAGAAHQVATPPSRLALEDLLGGRVLAWAGGLAVLLGLVLLFAIAVSRGWIGEGARVLLGACGCFVLGAVGVWLHEHRGRTEAALAGTSAAIAGLFVTVAVAARVYDLIPAAAGMGLALVVGAAGTAIAIRWRAPGIGALGLLGGLLAPVLAGATPTIGSLGLVWAAAAATTAVVIRQRWGWLTVLTFLATTGQWAMWLMNDRPGPAAALGLLVAFTVLNAAGAVGYEVRTRAEALRPSATLLLTLNVLIAAVVGRVELAHGGPTALADGWVAGLAVAHLAAGAALLRTRRVPHGLSVLLAGLGVVLADVALALVLHGLPRTAAYAAGAVGFAALRRVLPADTRDERVVGTALGAHVCLMIVQALAGPAAITSGGGTGSVAWGALLVVAAAAFASARLTGPHVGDWRMALDAVGLAATAYVAALALDGTALALAWAGEAVALAGLARRTRDPVAAVGGAAFTALAAGHALVVEAPPAALVDGLAHPLSAAAALGAVAGAMLATWWAIGPQRDPRLRVAALSGAGLTLLYLASVLLVDAFQPGGGSGIGLDWALSVRQQGQVLLSGLWALTGTATVVAGLRRRAPALRRAGLALLLVALGKVAIYDLSALSSVYRVGSCIVLGALLLLAAFAWQRLRPRPLPDLREMPPGLR